MNLLTSPLPDHLTVDGLAYAIKTDFRFTLRSILAYEDPELTGYEKRTVLLSNLFIVAPIDLEAALLQAQWFLDGGNPPSEPTDDPRLYSFSLDANLIFAAFYQTHGLDLTTAQLHWFKFLALFMDLGTDTAFCQLIGLRKRIKNGTASKEERQAARDMGGAFDVPEVDDRTQAEKDQEADFMRLIGAVK